MQTFDQSLMSHVKAGLISYEEALKHVSNPDDFALRFPRHRLDLGLRVDGLRRR